MSLTSPIFSLGYALRKCLGQGYGRKDFFADLSAGFVVSLIALPLAMALAIAVGLPPQHGIYTAIVAGFVAAMLGGSAVQVSGPTAAFVVVLAPIVAQYGLRGLIIAELMAGVMIIMMGLARLGRFINYVPYPVITGFTAGIAVVLATLSLNDFLGLGAPALHGYFHEKLAVLASHIWQVKWQEASVGFLALFILMFWRRVTVIVPPSIVAVAAASFAAYLLNQAGYPVATIGSVFTYSTEAGLMHGIAPIPPSLHMLTATQGELFSVPSFTEIINLFKPAVVIALLAALESLLSAKAADGLSGTRHHPNAELLGIGAANIASAFAAGIPATGAIARTAANIKSGAKSPIAAVLHAGFILLYVLLLAPLISAVPMAALAAILMITAYHMSHARQFFHIIKVAPRYDVIVLLICFLLTIFIDMVAGVMVGIICALLLFIRRISAVANSGLRTSEQNGAALVLPEGVAIFHITGPLFFGTAFNVLEQTPFAYAGTRALIIDLSEVKDIDITALMTLDVFVSDFITSGIHVTIVGNSAINEQMTRKIPSSVRVVDSVSDALLLDINK